MPTPKIQSGHLTEGDAAAALGMSVAQLRELVSARLLHGDAVVETHENPITFSRSDLVILRVLASQQATLA